MESKGGMIMNTIILFDSKRGTTKSIAEMIAAKTATPATVVPIEEAHHVSLSEFEKVVIGTPIYYGQPRKQTKEFLTMNCSALRDKELFLFVCGVQQNEEFIEKQCEEAFPDELNNKAKATVFLGGEVLFNRLNFFERFLLKKILTASGVPGITGKENYEQIDHEGLENFIRLINH